MMKSKILNVFRPNIFWLLLILFGCKKTSPPLIGDWVQQSEFDGVTRTDAVVFVINNIAYVGTGFNASTNEYYNDFWKYNPKENFWQRVADFPGTARSSAVAFAVNGKGYVGTGFDGIDPLKDFWQYDPGKDQWTQKNDFGGTARYGAVAFSVGKYGYMGTGFDGNDEKDFWQYDASNDTWNQIPSLGGSKRQGAVAFVLGNDAYVLCGVHNGLYQKDVWVLHTDQISNNGFPWTQKQDLDVNSNYTIVRQGGVAMVLNGEAYVATGRTASYTTTTWHYIPSNDTWEQKSNWEGTARDGAISFVADGRAFVGLGSNSTLYFDDLWEWRPNDPSQVP